MIALGAVALAGFVTFVVAKGHRVLRWTGFAVGALFVLLTAAAAVNAHYEYMPTLGSLWGDTGNQIVSADQLARRADGTSGAGCTEIPATGTITPVTIPAPTSQVSQTDGWVYLPPAWCTNDDTEYPVLVLIHGTPSPEGGHDWLTAMEGAKWADEFAAAHDGKAPVMVMPNAGSPNDTECADSPKYGRIETYLSEDVPAWIRSWDVFGGRIAEAPKGWMVGGYSMGGTCGLMLGVRHPDVWGTIGDYGGDLFGVDDAASPDKQRADTIRDLFAGDTAAFDQRDPTRLLRERRFESSGAWFGVGGADQGTLKDLRSYYDQAKAAGMQVCWQVVPGEDHTFIAWKPTFRDSLPWIAARTGLIPDSPAIQATCRTP